MAHLQLSQVLEFTGGYLFGPDAGLGSRVIGTGPETSFRDISTDTRTLAQGDLFLALRGANFDGHEFLGQAVQAGATGLLIDERAVVSGLPAGVTGDAALIVVADTQKALQDLAAGYRLTLPAPVIAITGSVGKTSTRGMVAACLQPSLQVCQTKANNNNEIGLPKTLLSATPQDQAIVLELGMRGRGEIELLSRIARPDIALITTIGLAHIERLGSQQEIFQAKAEILTGLVPGGRVILNADDPFLRQLAKDIRHQYKVSLVSTSQPDPEEFSGMEVFWADQLHLSGHQSSYRLRLWPSRQHQLPLTVSLPVAGRHMVSNSLFGLAVADSLGLDLSVAAKGAAQFENTGNRQRLIQAGSLLILDDSYNASPESMLAALETGQAIAGGRRLIAALGGMLELGDHAPQAHFAVGEAAARHDYAQVLALGPQAEAVRSGFTSLPSAGTCSTYADQPALIEALLQLLQPGDFLLVKGSRGFAMEQVTAAVRSDFAPDSPVLTDKGPLITNQGGLKP